jgi:hypothetical protein
MFNIFTFHVHKEINCHKIKLVRPLNVICQTHKLNAIIVYDIEMNSMCIYSYIED